ncbi:hypothetical protein FGRMN_10386 [Fusarium graminum]|nr:hypothetical protein FGRMN_10386 [Fusarium graminum]
MSKRRNSQDHALRKMAAVGDTENRRRVLQPSRSSGENQLHVDQQTLDKFDNMSIRECLREIDAKMAKLQAERNDLQSQVKPTDTPGRMDHESPVPLYQELIARDELRKINELRSEIERLRSDKKALTSQRTSLVKSIGVLRSYLEQYQDALINRKRKLMSWCDSDIIQILEDAGMTKVDIERMKDLVRDKL